MSKFVMSILCVYSATTSDGSFWKCFPHASDVLAHFNSIWFPSIACHPMDVSNATREDVQRGSESVFLVVIHESHLRVLQRF